MLTSDEKEQTTIIAKYFSNIFFKDAIEYPKINPQEMRSPFTKEEVQKAAGKMSNNKSPGIDEINAELIKYAPEEMFSAIALIFNNIARTGECPEEIIKGILCPLEKTKTKLEQMEIYVQ